MGCSSSRAVADPAAATSTRAIPEANTDANVPNVPSANVSGSPRHEGRKASITAPIVKSAQQVGKGVQTAGKNVQKVSDHAIKGAVKGVQKSVDVTVSVGTTAVQGVQKMSDHAIKGAQKIGETTANVGTTAVNVGTTAVHGVQKGAQKIGETAVKGVKTVGKGAKRGMDDALRRLSVVGNRFLDPGLALQLLRPIGDKMNEGAHHVKNIFAIPLNFKDSYKPPYHEKTEDERACIETALRGNFVFESLSDFNPLIDAFEKVSFKATDAIINQGDDGDYFYTVLQGEIEFVINDKQVGTAGPGVSFGELALLYTCPRAASVKALDDVVLFRVDQTCFRYLLKTLTEKSQGEKISLLTGVSFLETLSHHEHNKLSRVMVPVRFRKDDFLVKKGDSGDSFFVVSMGELKATNIESTIMKAGDFFGEKSLVSGEPHTADVVALTDGLAFRIDKATFERVLGKLSKLILRAQEQKTLQEIPLIQESNLDEQTLLSLAKLIKEKKFKSGESIFVKNVPAQAAMYFVREGKVQIQMDDEVVIKVAGDCFGEEQLLVDAKLGDSKMMKSTKTVPISTAQIIADSTLGVLTLEDCRKILDTQSLGKSELSIKDSLIDRAVSEKELKRHKILGAGTFGQVWLVSRNSHGERVPYALKVQSKYELIQDGQAKAVVQEKNIMATLRHPFLIRLVNSYQDESFVYMVMELIQGGELYNVIHTDDHDSLPEDQARFYGAGISEGLVFMHKRGFVYRDLKPENVLINAHGYPVIIDFGFAKCVTDKTYTLCGTPLYLAPEVILNRGHNWGADHWSMGVLFYEMITGGTPFYRSGMQKMDLFRAIVKGSFNLDSDLCSEACSDIIHCLLTRNPSQRLGSLAGAEDDILNHEWFGDIDFDMLRGYEIEPPYIPEITDPLDGSHFEDWSHLDDKTKKRFPKLKKEEADIFANF
ncbi:cGMP-dependent protein kinase 1 [Fistulifera solaris]|uniref:cGMP-dependent protein kinase n=1 Tax=Fistulifera solaris TaxID=1519565 RepID=A0A1Z5KRL7_FISSO|nr:cGMP-dependent protein kinase 1 [Fistulifera solaris]|eukprot:GAX28827.1 cGMP-dependent protein kinase 1 [Fistulifera solaris]